MKRNIILTLMLLSVVVVSAQNQSAAWKKLYPAIQKNIKDPKFRKAYYNIRDFGAVPNDTSVLNTEAINRAIATCSLNGGGKVVVPAGTWFTAPLTLKSNVNLHLEEGSTVLFTTNPKYFPVVLTRWEGIDCYNLQPLVYAYGETNIAITGKGTLDGGAANENWWKKCGAERFGWKEGDISQRTGQPKLMQWNNEKLPVSRRILSETDGLRPQMINFYRCNNVLIEGVRILRSPFWVIHPLMCNNLTVRGVYVENDGPNGDGCDPESCSNVLIENCYFNTGDDCIAIKSGRNNDGRLWAKPSENIIVRNCEMKNGHGGVVIGSEISGGYKNLFVENCKMDSPLLDRVIRIKTNTLRGGIIENIFVRNVEVGECKEAVLHINLLYEPREIGERGFIPVIRNVNLDKVNSQKSQYGVYIDGLPDQATVFDIHVSNSNFDGVKSGNKFTGLIQNVTFNNLKINGELQQNNPLINLK